MATYIRSDEFFDLLKEAGIVPSDLEHVVGVNILLQPDKEVIVEIYKHVEEGPLRELVTKINTYRLAKRRKND